MAAFGLRPRCRYTRVVTPNDRPPAERRLITLQLVGVALLAIGVGLLVWAAVAQYQASLIG